MRLIIRSGGQTGVDRAALDAAVELDLPYIGWCPKGGLAEDFPDPPGLLARYPLLKETSSDDPSQRTKHNVRDADATLILVRRPITASSGTDLARRTAERLGKPTRIVNLDAGLAEVRTTREWLRDLRASRGDTPLDLNVAGPRESQSPGIYAASRAFLTEALKQP